MRRTLLRFFADIGSKLRRWNISLNKHRAIFVLCAWLLYVLMVSIVAFYHEPWSDEAQAWLLARDSSVRDLLLIRMHYEGPVLWHLVLKILTSLHLGYGSMTVLSVIIASMGIVAFFRWSPFPLLLTVLIPFTYFLFYQYAVIARCYVLLPLLLFSVMIAKRDAFQKPARFFLLLFLLMNVSIHGFLLSGSLFVLHLLLLAKNWSTLSQKNRRKHIAWGTVLSVLFLIVLRSLWPASDFIAPEISNNLLKGMGSIIVILSSIFVLASCILARKIILKYSGVLFLIVLIFPQLLLMLLVYSNAWHEGILWLICLLASGEHEQEYGNKSERNIIAKQTFYLTVFLISAVHIIWAVTASVHDLYGPYSGAKDAAVFIKNNVAEDKTIVTVSYGGIGILPYFERNIFSNLHGGTPPSYFHWSVKSGMDISDEWMLLHRPDFLLLNLKIPQQNSNLMPIDIEHYVPLKKIPGFLYWKMGIFEEDSYVVYERKNE